MIGIVTVLYNSSAVLPDFLNSIDRTVGAEVHLFAVDNASSDESIDLIEGFDLSNVTVIRSAVNGGVAYGNNLGISAALAMGCDWIWLLNNDTYFDADVCAALVSCAESHGVRILTPIIEGTFPDHSVWFVDGTTSSWQGFRTRHLFEGEDVEEFLGMPVLERIDYAPTCALMVHKSVFAEIGLMDERFFVYFDDVDFCVRANKAGFAYYRTNEALVSHKASSLTGGKQSDFTVFWTSRNWPYVASKHLRGWRWFVALAYIQTWIWARFLVQRDSYSVFRLRLQRFVTGVRDGRAANKLPSHGIR